MYTVNKGPSKFVTKSRPGLIASGHQHQLLDTVWRADKSSIDQGGQQCNGAGGGNDATNGSLINDRLSAPPPRPVFHMAPIAQTGRHHNRGNHQHYNNNSNSNSHYNGHQKQSNGRHLHHHNGNHNNDMLTFGGGGQLPQHEELVRFLQDAWTALVPRTTAATHAAGDGDGEDATVSTSASSGRSRSSSNNSGKSNATNGKTSANGHLHSNNGTAKQRHNQPAKLAAASVQQPTTAAVFHSELPNATLKEFVAFDLESWWGRRLFHSITKGA